MRVAIALAAVVTLGGSPARAEDVVGTWLTEGGLSRVRIGACGSARCGAIIATKREASDTRNPDPSLRARSLVGVQLISDARRSGETWTGRLYNPLDGQTYTGKMRLLSSDQLELSGCVLGGLLCKAQTWTRIQ